MSKFERGFVALPDAVTPEVSISLDLPRYVDQNKIGANLRAIHSLARLGGISQVHVVNAPHDLSGSAAPSIIGYDFYGNAYAGKTSARSTTLFKLRSTTENEEAIMPARWNKLIIDVDVHSMGLTISKNKNAEGVNSPKEWSRQINGVLKKAIREGTRENLTTLTGDDLILALLSHGVSLSAAAILDAIDSRPNGVLFFIVYEGLIQALSQASKADTKSNEMLTEDGYRRSLFFIPQIDRVLLMELLSRIRTLVKLLEDE